MADLGYRRELTGGRRLAIEMLSSSARIIRSAQKHGYLDEDLRRTPKQLERQRKKGAPTSRAARGFQSGVVSHEQELSEEVRFWKSPAPRILAELGGIDHRSDKELIRWLK